MLIVAVEERVVCDRVGPSVASSEKQRYWVLIYCSGRVRVSRAVRWTGGVAWPPGFRGKPAVVGLVRRGPPARPAVRAADGRGMTLPSAGARDLARQLAHCAPDTALYAELSDVAGLALV